MKYEIQNSLLFLKFLRINKYVTKLSRFKILFDRANFRRIIKIQNPLLENFHEIELSRFKVLLSPQNLFRSLLSSSIKFSQNCQNSRSFFLFDPKFPQKLDQPIQPILLSRGFDRSISTKFSPLSLCPFLSLRSKFPRDRGKIHNTKKNGKKIARIRCKVSLLNGATGDSLASKIPFFLSPNPSFQICLCEGRGNSACPHPWNALAVGSGLQLDETWPKRARFFGKRRLAARAERQKRSRHDRPAYTHWLLTGRASRWLQGPLP